MHPLFLLIPLGNLLSAQLPYFPIVQSFLEYPSVSLPLISRLFWALTAPPVTSIFNREKFLSSVFENLKATRLSGWERALQKARKECNQNCISNSAPEIESSSWFSDDIQQQNLPSEVAKRSPTVEFAWRVRFWFLLRFSEKSLHTLECLS